MFLYRLFSATPDFNNFVKEGSIDCQILARRDPATNNLIINLYNKGNSEWSRIRVFYLINTASEFVIGQQMESSFSIR